MIDGNIAKTRPMRNETYETHAERESLSLGKKKRIGATKTKVDPNFVYQHHT